MGLPSAAAPPSSIASRVESSGPRSLPAHLGFSQTKDATSAAALTVTINLICECISDSNENRMLTLADSPVNSQKTLNAKIISSFHRMATVAWRHRAHRTVSTHPMEWPNKSMYDKYWKCNGSFQFDKAFDKLSFIYFYFFDSSYSFVTNKRNVHQIIFLLKQRLEQSKQSLPWWRVTLATTSPLLHLHHPTQRPSPRSAGTGRFRQCLFRFQIDLFFLFVLCLEMMMITSTHPKHFMWKLFYWISCLCTFFLVEESMSLEFKQAD